MGIFDGLGSVDKYEYDEYTQQAKLTHEMQMQKMQMQNAAMNRGLMNANVLGQGAYIRGTLPGAAVQPKERFDPNKHEAFMIPLSQLVTMWRLKYGDEWLDASMVHDGSFYAHACTRLNNNDMFENANGWVRLKEGVA